MKRLHSERGVALAVAIFALVVVGGLVAGALFVGTQEQSVGRNTLQQQQAFTAAEGANEQLLSNWNTALNDMPIYPQAGSVRRSSGRAVDGKGWYVQTVQRVSQMLFLVQTDGFSQDSASCSRDVTTCSRQRVGALVRLRPFAFDINAALKTQGQVRLGGSSYISGVDQPPSGWSGCPALQDTLPGIRMPDPSQIQTSGCSPTGNPPNYPCMQGEPQDVVRDTSINQNSLTTVGDLPFDSLRPYATKVILGGNRKIQPTALGGSCNTADQNNWGEPGRAGQPLNPALVPECQAYFPIIWVDGNLNINGVRGQGVLIVNGDLDVQGGFEFYGPVLVRGVINTQGTGGHFNGGVIAANVNLDQNVVLGDAVINFSTCAIVKAVTATATAQALRDRSWINLY